MKRKNKFLAFGITLCMLFSMAVVPTYARNTVQSGKCGSNLTWEVYWVEVSSFGGYYYDETLIISGTGDMWNYGENGYFYCSSDVHRVIIGDGVTSIGDNAFRHCNNLESVEISDSVTKIGDYAFYQDSLKSIVIPDSVTKIGDYAFSWNSLNSIVIPDRVISIGEFAFAYNTIYYIKIGSGVKSIGKWAFANAASNVRYHGTPSQWNSISIDPQNTNLINAKIYYDYDMYEVTTPQDNSGERITLPNEAVLDTGEHLNFRNGYVDATNGYVKAGDKKITGSNIYFNNEGKIRLQDGDTAKVEKDNGDGTTDQGFIVGVFNPTGIITMILEVTGAVNEVDYTGRTRTETFDFTNSEIAGLANFGFTVKNIPKPLSLEIKSIE